MPLKFIAPQNRPSGSRAKNRFHGLLLLIIGSICVIGLGSTFASNISLNSGAAVEFGQGVAQSTACDDSIIVTPQSSFVNEQGAGSYKFTSLEVSDINSSCSGVDFVIHAYKSGNNSPLTLYTTGGTPYDTIKVHSEDGTYTLIDAGLLADDITPLSNGFKVNFSTMGPPVSVASADASDVDRISIESTNGIKSGSLSFSTNWIGYGSNPAFALGTGDFTIEAWAKISRHYPGGAIYDTGSRVNNPGGFAFWVENDNLKYRVNGYPGEGGVDGFDRIVPMTGNYPDDHTAYDWYNTWHHYAVDRTGGIFRMFVDGHLVTSSWDTVGDVQPNGSTTPMDLTRTTPYIGILPGYTSDGYFLNGAIHSLRVVKGSALYTSTFTPPTYLAKVSNTLLLLVTHSDGTFSDESDNHWTPTDTDSLPTWVGSQP